jgi:uncharacterized membrane protein YeaQ/YmgE (transglycosylase-associated protein family)
MYGGMFFLFIVMWGMAIGWVAQLILGRARKAKDRDWLQAIIAGAAGSFLAGTAGSMLFREDFALRPAGIIGSIIGAVVVVAIWNAVRSRQDS